MSLGDAGGAAALLAAREPAGGRTVMFQSWRRLLFLHWKCDPAAVEASLPDGLEVDTFGGEAYVGIVPFFMCGIRPRWFPPVRGVSDFLELNVRTYVRPRGGGPPGVWFYSLDANSRPAVWAARRFFHLPYHHAEMRADVEGVEEGVGWVDYRCRRRGAGEPEARYRYRAEPAGAAGREAEPGTFPFFALERYWLYAHDALRNRLYRGQVSHLPYRYREAEVAAFDGGPAVRLGLGGEMAGPPDHQCVAEDVDVKILAVARHPAQIGRDRSRGRTTIRSAGGWRRGVRRGCESR